MKKIFTSLLLMLALTLTGIGLSWETLPGIWFSPASLKQDLRQMGIYQDIQDELRDMLLTQQETISTGIQTQTPSIALSEAQLSEMVASVFPAEAWQTWTESVIDQTEDWWREDQAVFDPSISIAEQKQRLHDRVQQALLSQANELPTCTSEELLELANQNQINLSCLPPGIDPEEYLGEDGWDWFDQLFEVIPERFSLRQVWLGELAELEETGLLNAEQRADRQERLLAFGDFQQQMIAVRDAVQQVEQVMAFWPLAAGLLWLSMLLLHFRQPARWLGWYGWGLILLSLQTGLSAWGLEQLWRTAQALIEQRVVELGEAEAWVQRLLPLVDWRIERTSIVWGQLAAGFLGLAALCLALHWWFRHRGQLSPTSSPASTPPTPLGAPKNPAPAEPVPVGEESAEG